MVFTSLLPGLRELRAPLAAGYLWLLALYIALEPLAPDRSHADGVWASLLRLEKSMTMAGAGVAATFVAYLLGSISAAMWIALLDLGRRARVEPPVAPRTADEVESRRGSAIASRIRAIASPLSEQATVVLHRIVNDRLEPVHQTLANAGTSLGRVVSREQPTDFELEAGDVLRKLMPQWRDIAREVPGAAAADDEAWTQAVIALEVRRTIQELDLARMNLLGKESELFSTIDRLRSEAEFRVALALPLSALAGALGWRAGWPAAVGVLGAMAMLASQAPRLRRQSNDALVEALRIQRTRTPALIQIETLAPPLAAVAELALGPS